MRIKKNFFVFIFLGFWVAVLYGPALKSPFIFRDYQTVLGNPGIMHASPVFLWRVDPEHVLTNITFIANVLLNPDSPVGFHLGNILLHLAAGFLVFVLVGLWRKTFFPSSQSDSGRFRFLTPELFAAMLFLIHPVATSTVCSISSRSVLLTTVFYLGAVAGYWCFRLKKDRVFYFFAFLSAILGSLAGPQMITLPVILLLLEWLLVNRIPSGKGKRFLWILPFLGIGILFMVLTLGVRPLALPFAMTEKMLEDAPVSWLTYSLVQVNAWVKYLQLLFFPAALNFDHDVPFSPGAWLMPTVLSLSAVLLLLRIGFMNRVRRPFVFFSLMWFCAALFPESSFFPQPDLISETRLYLPLFGFALFVTGMVFFLPHRFATKAVVLLYLLALTLSTFQRNQIWADQEWLLQDAIAQSPQKPRPRQLLADYYIRQRKYHLANEQIRFALAQHPGEPVSIFYLGRIAEAQRDYRTAARFYARASMTQQPIVRAKSLWRLGYINFFQGQMLVAEQFYLNSLAIFPQSELVLLDLGNLYGVSVRWREAEGEYRKALNINPFNLNARNGLASAMLFQGKNAEAFEQYFTLIKYFPRETMPYLNLARLYLSFGQPQKADPVLKSALEIDPENPKTYLLLATMYQDLDLADSAEQSFHRAIKLLRAHGQEQDVQSMISAYEEMKKKRGIKGQSLTAAPGT